MDSKIFLAYPRIPFVANIPEWYDVEIQIAPLPEAGIDTNMDLQQIYIETGQGSALLEIQSSTLHWMFMQQVTDKSGQLHETDPALWSNIALGPFFDVVESIVKGIRCQIYASDTNQDSTIPEDATDDEDSDTSSVADDTHTALQKEYSVCITGHFLFGINNGDIAASESEPVPFYLHLENQVWQYIWPYVKDMAIDMTHNTMPIECRISGGTVTLKSKSIKELDMGDFIPFKGNVPLLHGCAVIKDRLVPDVVVHVGDDSLIHTHLPDVDIEAQAPAPPVSVNGSDTGHSFKQKKDIVLDIELGSLQTTVGDIRALATKEDFELPFEDVLGQNVHLVYNKQRLATGELWQLDDVLGIRIQETYNG